MSIASKTAPRLNEAESPLAWLASRRGRDGQPLIAEAEFLAGERLRADLTFAQMLPSVTLNWSRLGGGEGSAMAPDPTEAMIGARQRVTHALHAVGPDFAGLLMDVCGFLKGLEVVERERLWPPRTAKVVLALALRQLARHYRIEPKRRSASRQWGAPDYRPNRDLQPPA